MTQEQSLEMQSCKELRPANVYDIAANETWLEDLARQGWRLTGMTGWNGVFQRAEPAVCCYRMQPLSRKEKAPPEDVIELYAALGWEYVCTLAGRFHIWRCDDPETPELDTDPVVQGMGYRYLKKRMVWDTIQTGVLFLAGRFHIWRCDDPETPELDTDPVVQGMGYRYLKKRMVWDTIQTGVLFLVLVWLYAWRFQTDGTPLLDALDTPPGRVLTGAGAYGLALFLMLCQIRSMGRLLRSLRAGVTLKRPKPYRRQKWLARGVLVCVVLFLGLGFLGSLRNIRGSSLAGGWDTGDSRHVPKAGVVYVDLRDLEGAEQTEFWSCRTKVHELCPRMYETRQLSLGEGEGPLRPGDSYPVDLEGAEQTEFWSCRTKVHELCPRMYETRQLSLGEGEGPLRPGDSYPVISSAETTHYRLLTEGLARRLTRELSRGRTASLGVYGHPALTAAETDGLDELWWGEDRYYQFLLARLGRQVLFLRYEGETDLRQAGAYFTALLDP